MHNRLPKFVEISSTQVNVFYYTVLFTVVSWIIGEFIIGKRWLKKVDVSKDIKVSMFAWKHPDFDQLREVSTNTSLSRVCKSDGYYDFAWGHHASERYVNHTCRDACAPGDWRSAGCVYWMEACHQMHQGVFFVTHYAEAWLGSNTRKREPHSFIYTFVEALRFEMSYGYSVSEGIQFGPWVDRLGLPFLKKKGELKASVHRALSTVVRNHRGEFVKRFGPKERLTFSVAQVLEYAGMAGSLDEVNADGGENEHTSGNSSFLPLRRLTGVELILKVSCFNNVTNPSECYLTFQHSKLQTWITRTSLDVVWHSGEQHLRQRVYHGISLRCETEGGFDFLDPSAIYLQVAAAATLLKLPTQITFFFVIYCLGHLSIIYRRILSERFNIREQVGGTVARTLATTVAFAELEDTVGANDEGLISKKLLLKRFREAFKKEDLDYLDTQELEHIVNWCFREQSQKPSSIWNLIRKLFGGRLRNEDCAAFSSHDHLDARNFCLATSSLDRVELADFVHLFDQDRKRGKLERLFLPKELHIDRETLKSVTSNENEFRPSLSNMRTGKMPNLETTLEALAGNGFDPMHGVSSHLLHRTRERRMAIACMAQEVLRLEHEDASNRLKAESTENRIASYESRLQAVEEELNQERQVRAALEEMYAASIHECTELRHRTESLLLKTEEALRAKSAAEANCETAMVAASESRMECAALQRRMAALEELLLPRMTGVEVLVKGMSDVLLKPGTSCATATSASQASSPETEDAIDAHCQLDPSEPSDAAASAVQAPLLKTRVSFDDV